MYVCVRVCMLGSVLSMCARMHTKVRRYVCHWYSLTQVFCWHDSLPVLVTIWYWCFSLVGIVVLTIPLMNLYMLQPGPSCIVSVLCRGMYKIEKDASIPNKNSCNFQINH